MKKGIKLSIVLLAFLLAIGTNAQTKKNKDMRRVSDSELIIKLASKEKGLVNKAVLEVLKRGERMIPALLAKKGDKRLFYGVLVQDPSFSTEFRWPTKNPEINNRLLKEGKLVTMEVAAVYLIVAIYYDSLDIAGSPYLTNLALPEEKRRAANTEDVIAKAWEALDVWAEKFKVSGLAKLRESKDAPLAEADVRFW